MLPMSHVIPEKPKLRFGGALVLQPLHVPTLFRRLGNPSKFACARATYYFHQCVCQLVYVFPYMGRALVNCILASSVCMHFLCIENREVRNFVSTVHFVLSIHYQTTRHI